MTQISNKALALLILATLVVVVTATTLQLQGGVTGFAALDSGSVNLTIAQNLEVEIDDVNNSITFGTCTPNASAAFSVETSDSTDESNGQCNATQLGTTAQYIQVNNIGNVNASVDVNAECSNAQFLPESTGSTNFFGVRTDLGPLAQCSGTTTGTYTALESGTDLTACDLLEPASSFQMSANVTIDSDTQTNQNCGGDTTNTITFNASQV